MMSQIIAPIHSYKKGQKNTHPYYLNFFNFIFYLANDASYDDSELNPVPTRFFVCSKNLAVQPNSEGISYTNINYLLGNKDVKIMKNLTIILIGCMTLALKVLSMLTLCMGSLTLKCAVLIYGWLPAHSTLVMGVAIFLINIVTEMDI